MGEGLILVQDRRLQFIFQGHQSVADELAALRQVCSPRLARNVLKERQKRGINREKDPEMKQKLLKFMVLLLKINTRGHRCI